MKNKEFCIIINSWHKKLCEDKRYFAELRRCKSLTEIFFCPAYHSLCENINVNTEKEDSLRRIALIAGVLAHIKKDTHQEKLFIAKQMAQKKSDKKKISEMRFKRILSARDNEQLFRQLIRIINQLPKFDIGSLAHDLYFWYDETKHIKHKWAIFYYSTHENINQEKGNNP